jgi:hypothetical protein
MTREERVEYVTIFRVHELAFQLSTALLTLHHFETIYGKILHVVIYNKNEYSQKDTRVSAWSVSLTFW